ncbi:seipin [Patagioenas fasciata]|uniref:seipin n=1 Tax=Patagioenas fasciata TaxID=372321 RepID=UPI003A98F458
MPAAGPGVPGSRAGPAGAPGAGAAPWAALGLAGLPGLAGRARRALLRALLRAGVAAAALLLLLWAALFLYGSFYCWAVPALAELRPVHFTFRTDCDPPGPELCSFPSANVSLGGRDKALQLGQLYQVSLELELPESPANRALGMFLVSGTAYGPGGRPIATAQRAAMLHYRSPLLRALHSLLFSLWLLGGLMEQKQTLRVELFEGYREDPYVPTERLQLQLQSKRVQIYGAQLRLHARLSGIRYLLYHFPLSSALVGVAGNFALLSAALLLGCLRWAPPPRRERPRPPPQTPPPARAEGSEGAGTAQRGEEPKEEEGPAPTREEPEVVGATEPSAEPEPPREEEEETKQEEEVETKQEEEEEEEASPTSPLPHDGHAHPPGPSPRRRLLCSSS